MPLAACSAVCIARTSLEITRGGRRSRIAANTEAAIAQPTTTPMKNPTLAAEHIRGPSDHHKVLHSAMSVCRSAR
jgi:hypothetical protein